MASIINQNGQSKIFSSFLIMSIDIAFFYCASPNKVNSRSVRKYGSVKAILLENERMSQTGIWIIHPYSSFRLIWDMFTLILLLLNMLVIPIFMAFPGFLI